MIPADSSHHARAAPALASYRLRRDGFSVLRTARRERFDLVAWKGDLILFVVVRRTRSAGVSEWTDLVRDLARLSGEGLVPGMIQLWLLRSGDWHRYRVLAGGLVPEVPA